MKDLCAILVLFRRSRLGGKPCPTREVVAETPAQAEKRHAQVAGRRQQTVIICHRGASEFAHENTLEAYRATFELGGDGNEIDIRGTKDGVLVCFHDDMLDRLLEAYGDGQRVHLGGAAALPLPRSRPVRRALPHSDPASKCFCCIAATAGCCTSTSRSPAWTRRSPDLLDELDMWDHVAFCNDDNAGVILRASEAEAAPLQGDGLFDGPARRDPGRDRRGAEEAGRRRDRR